MKLNWVKYNRVSSQDLLELMKRIEKAYRIIESNKDNPVILEREYDNNQKVFEVKSSSETDRSYQVDVDSKTCSCPDFNFRFMKCKHLLAVELISSPPIRPQMVN